MACCAKEEGGVRRNMGGPIGAYLEARPYAVCRQRIVIYYDKKSN